MGESTPVNLSETSSRTRQDPEVNDDSSSMRKLALDAFEELRQDMRRSGTDPTFWSMLDLLFGRYGEQESDVEMKIDSRGFIVVVKQNSHSDYGPLLAREFLSLLFEQMASVEANVSILPENAVEVCVPMNTLSRNSMR
jgi:hypothetical protein